MFRRFTSIFIILLTFVTFPLQTFAVEYSINRTQIDAYLQENGSVNVEETHTYEFEGKFNGITRELIPKKGTEITDFKANENGKPLQVEKEGYIYIIHRKGKDETITIDLTYTIENGVDVYSDVGEFYWPFFDEGNESTYEDLTVTVQPPSKTDDVIAFGYDEAFDKASIQPDGTVTFKFGKVPDGRNGDIRVAYDQTLFPSANMTPDQPMKDEILGAQRKINEEAAAKAARRNTIETIGQFVIPIFAFIILALIFTTGVKSLIRKRAVEREANLSDRIPNQWISLPATIYFSNYKLLPPEALSAALLDLVRQDYVKQDSENRFRIVTREGTMKQEKVLMEWLFDEIGENEKFGFEDLTRYAKKKSNHETYQIYQTRWKQALEEEVREQKLYEGKVRYRLGVGLSSLLVLPFIILFPIYGLFFWMLMSIIVLIVTITYAFAYHPLTWKGALIAFEWKAFKEKFRKLSDDDWQSWLEDDRMRAFIYGLGTRDKKILKKNEELAKVFYGSKTSSPEVVYSMDVSTMIILASVASASFSTANESTNPSSSSSSTGTGGGVGGGGGGSGAF
ncbi:DUF2207 domain-containing protein [Pseudalkalibacillus salsuginis]|uniref:DUF2207 domain-containing protein n=1 Tax=Pseudalkalibacillus salsuginis TaxID=2910972 RepID=UPI001F25B3C6|nr:DUF2207 domain-containing protein [Pseudalkalibacillus salsuginis]MCF6409764.1 DUF2207 domain-containing protein [Pseudalkalibacillus salsuginis]